MSRSSATIACLLLLCSTSACHRAASPTGTTFTVDVSGDASADAPTREPGEKTFGHRDTSPSNDQSSSSPVKPSARKRILFDSYHAHNFLYRGLVPGEYAYHRMVGLRRASRLLENRGQQVEELIVGPVTAEKLADVALVVVNLPSMDRPPWLVSEIAAVESYIRDGGGIIFITDHSNCYYHQYHLLPLWDRLGLTPTFETVCEADPMCMTTPSGSGWLCVRRFEDHPVTRNVHAFATQTGGRVAGDGIIAWSSDKAWADAGAVPLYGEGNVGLFGDMLPTDTEEQGRQGIVLARQVGNGRVVVIADQNSVGDCVISYADNWCLWLNACQWAGQLSYSSPTAAKDQQGSTADTSPANAPANAPANEPAPEPASNFERLVASEPDLNAPIGALPKPVQVECWEAIEAGRFTWGGGDLEQYYNFWCWMNRWAWVSASDRAPDLSAVRPEDTLAHDVILFAVDIDLESSRLAARLVDVLSKQGKVVLLPAMDASSEADASAILEHAKGMLDKLGTATKLTPATKQIETLWHAEPIGHLKVPLSGGTLVIVPNAEHLRNGRFLRPEQSPDAASLKWLATLHRWLFNTP